MARNNKTNAELRNPVNILVKPWAKILFYSFFFSGMSIQ